jgi:hypothetical protein
MEKQRSTREQRAERRTKREERKEKKSKDKSDKVLKERLRSHKLQESENLGKPEKSEKVVAQRNPKLKRKRSKSPKKAEKKAERKIKRHRKNPVEPEVKLPPPAQLTSIFSEFGKLSSFIPAKTDRFYDLQFIDRNFNSNDYEILLQLDETVKKRGVSPDEMKNIDNYVISSRCELKFQNECIICRLDFELQSSVAQLPCNHIFHHDCIGHWLRSSTLCPLCRHDIRED